MQPKEIPLGTQDFQRSQTANLKKKKTKNKKLFSMLNYKHIQN